MPTAPSKTSPKAVQPRILVVDDEPALIEFMGDVVSKQVNGRMIPAATVREARRILASQRVDLLVADVNLPDGNGMALIDELQDKQPDARAIVITGTPGLDHAISALRQGALDFVPKPFAADHLIERVSDALRRQAASAKNNKRLGRLRQTIKRLNGARKIVNKKVDLLCNDLVGAYGELSQQLEIVRAQDGFSKAIAQARDLEQLLCHAMDWLLRRLGYSNIALWLAANDTDFQLGAYMKYTIASDDALIEAMKRGVVRMTVADNLLHLSSEEVQQRLTPDELDYLADQEILAVNCSYLCDSLAVVALFRDGNQGFTDTDAETLRNVAPLFAGALAAMIRSPEPDPDPGANNPFSQADDEWWKRGEDSPF